MKTIVVGLVSLLIMALSCGPAAAWVHSGRWGMEAGGGGFWRAEKFGVAPERMPDELHWFKYEAYFTWLTGFLLLAVIYYFGADAFLIDKEKIPLDPVWAAALAELGGADCITLHLREDRRHIQDRDIELGGIWIAIESIEVAHHDNVVGAIVAAKLLNVHGNEIFVLEEEDAKSCKRL